MKQISLILLLIASFTVSGQMDLLKKPTVKSQATMIPFSMREATALQVRTQKRLKTFVKLDSLCVKENEQLWRILMVDQAMLGLDCSSLEKRREQSQLLKSGYEAEKENNKNLTAANLVLMDDRDKWQRKAKRRMKAVLWGVPISLGVGVIGGIYIAATH